MTREVRPPRFVGRGTALADLARALAEPPALALVEGEAGIGKSRLVRELLATPAGRVRPALLATCPPVPDSLALGAVAEAVRRCSATPAGLRLTGLAGALRPLFPEWTAQLPPAPEPLEDAQATRHRLFRALAELFDRLQIGVLVVEDAHWADDATLELLLFLASRPPPGVSLLVTYRPEDLPAGSLLLRLSSRLPAAGGGTARVSLAPLDIAGTAELASSMFDGAPVSGTFARFLHERTGGVPLAVEELVRLLGDRADARRDGASVRRRLDRIRVPPTVRELVLARVRGLAANGRQVVAAAAVLAGAGGEPALAQVAGLGLERVRTGLAEAVRAGLLVEDQRGLGFRHALMGRAVYQAIPAPQRRRLHLRAGRVLARAEPPPVVQLARHFRAAGAIEQWRRYAELAADLALPAGDPAAVSLLDDVLASTLPGGGLAATDRARLALKLAAAALRCAETEEELGRQVAGTLRATLDSPGLDRPARGQIRGRLGRLLMQLREYQAGRSEMELAIPDLAHDPVEAAHLMVSLGNPAWRPDALATGGHPWPAQRHRRWLHRAAELLAGPIPAADRLSLTSIQATALLQLGEPAGWRVAAGVPYQAGAATEPWSVALGCLNLGDAAVLWGRYPQARRRLDASAALAGPHGFRCIGDIVAVTRARLDWYTGAWDGLADRVAALAGDEDLDAHVRLEASLVAGLLAAAGGSRRRAETRLRRVLDWPTERSNADLLLGSASALGRLLLAERRADAAVQLTAGPVRLVTSKGIWVWATDIAPVRVAALVATGQVARAARLVSDFARGLRGRDAPAAQASLATCRAILAEPADALAAAARYGRAAEAWQRLPRPYEALLARERQARCLLDAGRDGPGLARLSQVFHELAALGARGDATRVMHTLRARGVEARRPWWGGRRSYGDRLSPRELEVVDLVVAGSTNREIARALSRSPRTVATQLSSAMRKLDVPSRTALAVAALAAGLVSGLAPAERSEQDHAA